LVANYHPGLLASFQRHAPLELLGAFLLGSARPGHWEGREDVRQAGLEKARTLAGRVISKKAREAYGDLLPMMKEWRAEPLTLQEIGERLNAAGHTTRRGKLWNPVQVARVLERSAE
jgi:hypothetical protein